LVNDETSATLSIPELDDQCLNDADSVPDISKDLVTSDAAISQQSNEDIANSTTAWSSLVALLGSPAPSCVLPKERTATQNLWVDDATIEDDEIISLACSEIDHLAEDDILPPLPISDEDTIAELSLSGLQLDSDDACVPSKDEDASSSVLAWTALTALLGSPAPQCVALKKESREVKNLWADDEEDGIISLTQFELPCLDESDDLSLSALNLGSDDLVEATLHPKKEEDIANSTIAWGALTALLGMPAPACVQKKDNRQVKNLWADDLADADEDIMSLAHSQSAMLDDGTITGLSLSALQLDSDELNQHGEEQPLKLQNEKDALGSTIAWGALTAFLGLPAPSCVLQKSTRPVKNLWSDDNGDEDDLISLDASCDDDCGSIPSLLAVSQSESPPSSPVKNAVSSFGCDQDNVVDSIIQWSH
jgi:hypothetical protein